MRIYLINRTTGETIREFSNVVDFGEDFVLFSQSGNLCKIYAGEDEGFTDKKEVQEDATEAI